MDPIVNEWLNLIVRWAHIITGIAWIGTSFFFNWLDTHLTPPEREGGDAGVEGELWLVHSGGFYHVEKKQLAPDELPATLHWFKWEAAFTWITGILLLAIVYYLGADVYLVDRGVSDIGSGAAIALGLGTLVVSWFVYDALWRSPLAKHGLVVVVVSYALMVAVAFALSEVLGGRAAYIHVGAMLGTLMAANVWVHIIPAQRNMVAATEAGEAPDTGLGAHAKQRSLHNNYMTLPVVFIMVSNHFPGTYGHELNWAVLAVLTFVGAGVRHYFNVRDRGGRSGLWCLAAAAAAMIALFVAVAPPPAARSTADADAGGEPVPFAAIRAVIGMRCIACHSATPTNKDFAEPPADVAFDTPEQIHDFAERIFARAVVSRTMPLGNSTGITQEERDLLGRWISQGAALDQTGAAE